MPDQFVKVGKYILLEKLAIGGMAEVFLAKTLSSEKLNKFVAIKKILPHFSDQPEFLNLFKEEIEVSLNLNHGNIVTHFDFINENGQYYLVMEFVNGINLRQIEYDLKMSKTQFSIPQILYIVSQIAAGLDYAHRCTQVATNKKLNIIHRDLSPHNVMITFDGLVKIIDFGIAKASTQLNFTKVGLLKGKFSYMSPEQSKAEHLDHRSDLYSLGIILWELLTGERLFEGKNDFETLKKISSESISRPSSLDQRIISEVDQINMKLLEKNAEDRYQNAADLKFDIDQLLSQKFPQFRPLQMTEFLESLYLDVIKAKSEKLVEYSQFKLPEEIDTYEILKNNSRINQIRPQAPSKISVNSTFKTGVTNIGYELPDGFKTQSGVKVKEQLNFDKLKKNNPFATDIKITTKQKAAQFFENGKPKNVVIEDESIIARDGSFLGNFKHLFMILVFIYAGFSFYKEFLDDGTSGIETTEQSSEQVATQNQPKVEEHLSTADSKLTVHEKNNAQEDNYSKEVYKKLKENSQLSYANIVTENLNSQDTKLFVDGKLIFDKSPVKLYPIYSNKQIKIVAYNAKLNLYDEKTVVAKPGKSVEVRLYLRPYGRKK